MAGPYINEPGHEVPENKIIVIPNNPNDKDGFKKVIESLKGNIKRDWFNEHFYYCLPLNIGNQYGFIVKSLRTFEIVWDGTHGINNDVSIKYLDEDVNDLQIVTSQFGSGVVTIQNAFHFKTPIGVNLMTFQPPNMFIPGVQAMAGVVETDNLRRDFTFNLKITDPGRTITINAGDAIGAFMPVPRYFVDGFDLQHVSEVYSPELYINELLDGQEFTRQRNTEDTERAHLSGRKYFNGIHAYGEKYADHQKRMS